MKIAVRINLSRSFEKSEKQCFSDINSGAAFTDGFLPSVKAPSFNNLAVFAGGVEAYCGEAFFGDLQFVATGGQINRVAIDIFGQ